MHSGKSEGEEKPGLAGEPPVSETASIVRELLPLLPSGPALDIACGSGRHTLLLAARGQHVTAVDWSGAALGILETRARAVGVAVRRILSLDRAARASHGGVALMQADLGRTQIPGRSYRLILCIQYLQRSLFP